MAKKSKQLTPPQLVALASLGSSATTTEAAEQVGVDRRTVYRWQTADPEFMAAWAGLRADTKEKVAGQLRALAAEAMETIRAVMTDAQTPAAVRLKAAWSVVEAVRTEYIGEEDSDEIEEDLEARADDKTFLDLLRGSRARIG